MRPPNLKPYASFVSYVSIAADSELLNKNGNNETSRPAGFPGLGLAILGGSKPKGGTKAVPAVPPWGECHFCSFILSFSSCLYAAACFRTSTWRSRVAVMAVSASCSLGCSMLSAFVPLAWPLSYMSLLSPTSG